MPNSNESSLGISDILIWLRSNWLPILVPTFFFAVLGVLYILVASPKYKVETLLAPQDSASSDQLLNQFGSQLGALGLGRVLGQDGQNQTEVSIAILESRQFLGDFISRHDLMPVLFASQWDEEAGDWAEGVDPIPTINDAYRRLSRNVLLVDRDEVSGLVTVSMEWFDAEVAHGWLTQLISDLNQEVRRRERDEARRSLEFLREELARTDIVELQQALHQLSRAELQKLTLANVRDEFAFKTIDPPYLPDADDPIWPKPPLILLSSIFLGLFFGLGIAVMLTAWRLSARPSVD